MIIRKDNGSLEQEISDAKRNNKDNNDNYKTKVINQVTISLIEPKPTNNSYNRETKFPIPHIITLSMDTCSMHKLNSMGRWKYTEELQIRNGEEFTFEGQDYIIEEGSITFGFQNKMIIKNKETNDLFSVNMSKQENVESFYKILQDRVKKIDISLETRPSEFFGLEITKAVFSEDIYDNRWEEEDYKGNQIIQPYSLKNLANRLYDTLNSQDKFPKNSVFFIEGVEFARVNQIHRFHLDINEDFPAELIKKYGYEEIKDFTIKDTGDYFEITSPEITYTNSDTGNVLNDKGEKRFHSREEAIQVLNKYLTTPDSKNNSTIHPFSVIKAKLDGEEFGTFIKNKKIQIDKPNQEKRRKFKR